jgi:hypothetical protein
VGCVLLAACGGSASGPGSFVGTASNAAVYVTWTRSKDALTGELTQAFMPEKVGDQVQTDRVSFTGTVSDSAVSLRLDEGLGSTSTLTGTLDGDTLTLNYPGQDGGVTTVTLRRGDGAAFNTQLAALRGRAARDKRQADEQAAQAQAASDAAAAVENVRRQIDALAQAADNATASDPDLYQSDLDTIRSDLDTAKSDYEVFTSDQENHYSDSYCDDAGSLAEDVTSIHEDIKSMHSDVKSNTDPGQIDSDVHNLRDQFAAMQSYDPSLIGADAPTQDDVDAAIHAARQKVKGAGGADFASAGKLLAKAEALQATAQGACDRTRG